MKKITRINLRNIISIDFDLEDKADLSSLGIRFKGNKEITDSSGNVYKGAEYFKFVQENNWFYHEGVIYAPKVMNLTYSDGEVSQDLKFRADVVTKFIVKEKTVVFENDNGSCYGSADEKPTNHE